MTTGSTKVAVHASTKDGKYDGAKWSIDNKTTRICCPEIVSAKLLKYAKCSINTCKKKINSKLLVENEKTVDCSHCHGTLLQNKLQTTSIFDFVIEKADRQYTLTAFPECVRNYFSNSGDFALEGAVVPCLK